MFRLVPNAPDTLPKYRAIKNYFKVQRWIYTAMGLDPTSVQNFIFNPVLTFLPIFSIVTLIWPMASLTLKSTNDLNKMAKVMGPMWQSFMATCKISFIILNRKSIAELVRKVWNWNMGANGEELVILNEENRYDYLASLSYFISVLTTGFLAVVAPLISASYHSWIGGDFYEDLDLPLKADYYINPKSSNLNYSIDFIWSTLGIWSVCNTSIASDALFTWFMRNISARFRILNLRFRSVADKTKRRNFNAEDLSKSIIDCVQYHRRVIELAEQLNSVYRPIVFFKFLISCVQLATLTFQFSEKGEIADQAFCFSFFISITIQVMLYCYGGQRIQEMSKSVSENIYESFYWHNISIKSKKMLLIIMMRAEKPCTMTGIFFITDLSLFVWVYRTAASFLTMMISMA